MRLIDADALKTRKSINSANFNTIETIQEWIDNAPTIDAVPSAEKTGHWIIDIRGNWACNICGNDPYHSNMKNMNYCPNCGARMERRADELNHQRHEIADNGTR